MTEETETAEIEPAGAAAVIAAVTPAPTVVKVRIDAGGREVELETTAADASMDTLATTALALWRATGDGPDGEPRGVFGLVTAERAPDRSTSSTLDYPVEAPH